jgi:hypothetical protein
MTIDEVVNVFLACHEIEDRDALGWTWWQLEGQKPGRVGAIDTEAYLRKVFAVKLLMAAEGMPDERLRAHVLPAGSKSLTFYIDQGQSSIRPVLEDIRTRPQNWEGILSAAAIAKIPTLLGTFDNTLKALADREEAEVIASQISTDKIDEFWREAKGEFAKHTVLAALGSKHQFLRTDLSLPLQKDAPKSWGYNTVVSKEAFIADWHVHYGGFGGQYGVGMAHSEDLQGLQALAEAFPTWKDPVRKAADIPVFLAAAIEGRKASGGKANALISSLDIEEITFMHQMEQFVPRWRCPKNEIAGFMGNFTMPDGGVIPVYRVRTDQGSERTVTGIFLVDLSDIGEMIRLFPCEAIAEQDSLRDHFYLRVVDLNVADEERRKILAGNPAWLQEQVDKERHLRSRALLQFYERVVFRFRKTAGIRLLVKPSEDELISGAASGPESD